MWSGAKLRPKPSSDLGGPDQIDLEGRTQKALQLCRAPQELRHAPRVPAPSELSRYSPYTAHAQPDAKALGHGIERIVSRPRQPHDVRRAALPRPRNIAKPTGGVV